MASFYKKSGALTLVASLAALLFNNWVFGSMLNFHLLVKGGSISELSASTQPHHWLFRILDVAAGLVIAYLAILIAQLHLSKAGRWLAGLLTLLGLANAVDAFFPLPCSGTLEANCSSPISLIHFSIPSHAYSSTVIGACFLLLLAISLWQCWQRKHKYFRSINLAALASTLVFFGLLLSEALHGSYSGNLAVGYSQQAQMLLFGIWMALLPRQEFIKQPKAD